MSETTKQINNQSDEEKSSKLFNLLILLGGPAILSIVGGPILISIYLVIIIVKYVFGSLINLTKYQDRNKEIKNYFFICYYIFFVFMYMFYGFVFYSKINVEDYSGSFVVIF